MNILGINLPIFNHHNCVKPKECHEAQDKIKQEVSNLKADFKGYIDVRIEDLKDYFNTRIEDLKDFLLKNGN